MFAIERVRADAEIREQSEIDTVVRALAAAGHQPVLRSMVTAASQVSGLHENSLGVDILITRDPRYRALAQHVPVARLLRFRRLRSFFGQSRSRSDNCRIQIANEQVLGGRLVERICVN